MKIEKKLEILLQYYLSTRRAGHTTLMKEGTNHYDKDFFVLAHNMEYGETMGFGPKSAVSWQNLDKLIGHNKPLAIDNGPMTELLADVLVRIEALKEENKKLLKEKGKFYISRK